MGFTFRIRLQLCPYHTSSGLVNFHYKIAYSCEIMTKLAVEKWNQQADGALNEENMKKKLKIQGYHCTMYNFSPGENFFY